MSSYVDLMGDVRWSEPDHVTRVESGVRSDTTHTREHVLIRRSVSFAFYLIAQMLPAGHPAKDLVAQFGRTLTPAALAELQRAAAVFDTADVVAAQARVDAARLDLALDYEETRAALAALPAVPEEGEDPDAERRAELQALLAAASADTLELVAQRAAFRAPVQQPDPIQEGQT